MIFSASVVVVKIVVRLLSDVRHQNYHIVCYGVKMAAIVISVNTSKWLPQRVIFWKLFALNVRHQYDYFSEFVVDDLGSGGRWSVKMVERERTQELWGEKKRLISQSNADSTTMVGCHVYPTHSFSHCVGTLKDICSFFFFLWSILECL